MVAGGRPSSHDRGSPSHPSVVGHGKEGGQHHVDAVEVPELGHVGQVVLHGFERHRPALPAMSLVPARITTTFALIASTSARTARAFAPWSGRRSAIHIGPAGEEAAVSGLWTSLSVIESPKKTTRVSPGCGAREGGVGRGAKRESRRSRGRRTTRHSVFSAPSNRLQPRGQTGTSSRQARARTDPGKRSGVACGFATVGSARRARLGARPRARRRTRVRRSSLRKSSVANGAQETVPASTIGPGGCGTRPAGSRVTAKVLTPSTSCDLGQAVNRMACRIDLEDAGGNGRSLAEDPDLVRLAFGSGSSPERSRWPRGSSN
jgi:hypothetical protein